MDLGLGLSLKLHTMIYLILNNIYIIYIAFNINSKFYKALSRLNFGLHLFYGVWYWPYSLLHIITLSQSRKSSLLTEEPFGVQSYLTIQCRKVFQEDATGNLNMKIRK